MNEYIGQFFGSSTIPFLSEFVQPPIAQREHMPRTCECENCYRFRRANPAERGYRGFSAKYQTIKVDGRARTARGQKKRERDDSPLSEMRRVGLI